MTPMIIDIRLVRLRDGQWRIRTASGVHEMGAPVLPAFVHALVRDIVSPRSFARSRFHECPVTKRGES